MARTMTLAVICMLSLMVILHTGVASEYDCLEDWTVNKRGEYIHLIDPKNYQRFCRQLHRDSFVRESRRAVKCVIEREDAENILSDPRCADV